MLLTITYHGRNTQELGYLLHKHPSRIQEFQLPRGKAYVFYPEVSDCRTTAALLLDLNPLELSRGKAGSRYGKMWDYVNDRPYAASSFLCGAISRVFGTAMNGRCEVRQALADCPLSLSAHVYMLPVRGKKEMLHEIFKPLGYRLSYQCFPIDEQFPEWGESPYVNLTLSGQVRLSDLLNHLYVLIPVFDYEKHYYISSSEIDKLLLHGTGWLETHPMKEYIIRRYFAGIKSYTDIATHRISEEGDSMVESEEKEIFRPLDQLRIETVQQEIKKCNAVSVIDLGCGEGKLLECLCPNTNIQKLHGMDVSAEALKRAEKRLFRKEYTWQELRRIQLFQGSLLYKDSRIQGFDAACVIEVVEHIAPEKRELFEKILFQTAAPRTIILTTPNREYNVRFCNIGKDGLRHEDHRFEWTRKEFSVWAAHVCEEYGYEIRMNGIGKEDETYGCPTQMGVFTKCG